LDAHVVSDNVDDLLQPLALAGTTRVTFQLEQILFSEDSTDMSPVIALVSKIRALNMSVGVCIAPSTSVEKLELVLSSLPLSESGEMLIEAVDILAVSPGFGGQKFNNAVLQKVAFIHKSFPGLAFLEVDGGVNMVTASLAAEAGANVLIAGRYVVILTFK
jgi:ribulose-phosphate 3-epimerase